MAGGAQGGGGAAGLVPVEGGAGGDQLGDGNAVAGDCDLGAALDLIEEGGEAVLGFVEGDEHEGSPSWLARSSTTIGRGPC